MIRKERFTVRPLNVIPEGSEFMLGNNYAKINSENELELWLNNSWVSKRETLEEYNCYWIKSFSEYTLSEYIEYVYNGIRKNYYFFYDPASGYYYSSYNKPVQKGFVVRNGESFIRFKAGECSIISPDIFPQLTKMIDKLDGFNLYDYEEEVRYKFEQQYIIKGHIIPEFNNLNNCYYVSYVNYKPISNINTEYKEYCEKSFYDFLDIKLTKD